MARAKLPKKPTMQLTWELIELMRLDPKGMTSYFEWLATEHPAIFAALLGRAMPQIMRHEEGEGAFEAMYRTAEEIEAAIKSRNLPPLKMVFQLPSAMICITRPLRPLLT
jgi:hypothetical protein